MKKILLTLSIMLTALVVTFAQRNISGTVTDGDGAPLIGASVVVKGTTTGTVADTDGKYELSVPAGATTIVFSFAGYASEEVAIGTTNVIDASLKEGLLLEETVVTAFGIKKDKSNLGYAVAQLDNKELTLARTTNVTNSLAGKIAGIRLSGSGGSFSSSSITIRGNTTFSGSNQPLYVVDGVQVDNSGGGNNLQNGVTNSSRAIDLNQEDIETISVLKGAGATSLYGSRGANGVILITTKQGKAGQKKTTTYSTNYAIQEPNRLPDYQNIYGQGTGGAFNVNAIGSWGARMAGQRVLLPQAFRTAFPTADSMTNYSAQPDNVKDIFQRGSIAQHNLSFQGATSEKTTYRVSLGYADDKGVLENNRLKRYNIGLNATSAITDRLTSNISVNYSLNRSNRSAQGNQLSNPLFRSWFTPRSWDLTNQPFQDAVGNQLHYDAVVDNPYWTLKNNLYNDQVDRLFGNTGLRYQFNDWLSADYKVGIDQFTSLQEAYDQIGARGSGFTNANTTGGIYERRDLSRSLNSTLILRANKKFGDYDVTVLAGNEVLDQTRNDNQIIGRGVTVRNFRNIGANTTTQVPSIPGQNRFIYRLVGYFLNGTVSYKNWATLDLAGRIDQNSVLPTKNNTYAYYSTALTVNLTEAIPSLKSDAVNALKLRANTGLTGAAQPIFRYSTDNYYGLPNPADGFGPNIQFPFNGLPGFTLQDVAGNPNLKPEFTRSSEFGIDAGLFKNRIELQATVYQQKSTDIIVFVPNSPAAGVSSVAKNAGSMTTNGFEASLTLVPLKTKLGTWSTTFNFTKFRTNVDALAPGVPNVFLAGFVTPNIRLVAGEQYGQIFGNAYVRDSLGRIVVNSTGVNAGLPRVTANVQKIGNPNPDWTLGVTNNITVKGVTLSFILDIKQGGDQYSRNLADLHRQGVADVTASKDRFNADGTVAKNWIYEGAVKQDGTPNDIFVTAEQYWGNAGKHVAAEGFIYNTSWFRLRELSLGYSLPKKWLEKSLFGSVDVSVFGRNLFLYAPNYPHFDPEQNVLGVSNAQGLEFNALPQMRTLGADLRVTF